MKPNQLQRAFYGFAFKGAYLDKRGTAFQDWFVKIAGHAYGPDFEEVKPYGPQGDHKCDGLHRSLGMLFQCYAPDRFEDGKAISKITADFSGAVAHWPGTLKTWTFVHNDRNGLSPGVTKCLIDLSAKHSSVAIAPWNDTELHNLVMTLEVHQLEDLFGFAPSIPRLQSRRGRRLRGTAVSRLPTVLSPAPELRSSTAAIAPITSRPATSFECPTKACSSVPIA